MMGVAVSSTVDRVLSALLAMTENVSALLWSLVTASPTSVDRFGTDANTSTAHVRTPLSHVRPLSMSLAFVSATPLLLVWDMNAAPSPLLAEHL